MDEIKVVEKRDEDGKQLFVVTSPKFKSDFHVYKLEDGFAFYGIRSTVAKTNRELDGKWTNPRHAVEFLVSYLKKAKPSPSVERDEKYKRNHEVSA